VDDENTYTPAYSKKVFLTPSCPEKGRLGLHEHDKYHEVQSSKYFRA